MVFDSADNPPLEQLLATCCEQLFDEYALPVQPLAAREFPGAEELVACSVMVFGGKQLCGELVLAATRQPLEGSNRGDPRSQGDWICELANQLVGRLKNQLLRRKVEILLSTPTVFRGEELPFGLQAPQVFAAQGGGFVYAWLDYQFAEGCELPAGPVSGAPAPLLEGELLLF